MKNNFLYKLSVVFFLLCGMTSCDWLDLEPKDTTTETDLFEVGDGYRVALNGIYQQMGSTSLYGKELTWGFLEVLSQTYSSYELQSTYRYAASYNYDDESVKSIIQSIWEKCFNNIANCNNIIQRIQEEPNEKFEKGQSEKEMILGEALALRAFLHFDLLRLFAPSMQKDDGMKYLPYVDVYPCTFMPYSTNKDIIEKVLKDLKKASSLLEPFDTKDLKWMMTLYRIENDTKGGSGSDDLFFAYRGYRMNYFAVCAMLARVYNYAGMHEEAANEATKVIDAKADAYQTKLFSNTSRSDASDGNVKLYDDVIFCLSNRDLWLNYKPYQPSGSDQLVLSEWGVEDIYDLASADTRALSNLVQLRSYKLYCLRNMEANGTFSAYVQDMIPMIRLGEMHYIRAEYYLSLPNISSALKELDSFRSGYGCAAGNLSEDVVDEILKEIHREYLTEGQLFFNYKKFNVRPSGMSKEQSFVLPRPDSEDL